STTPTCMWPTRMVQISEHTIRVLAFDFGTMAGQYAALSYCWGSQSELEQNPPYKMTTSTFGELQCGVSWLKMPLTLQHAFTLCKSLGIEYIWIDSLCIMQAQCQNDAEAAHDWNTESSKMAAIYSNSKLTIIAASGSSCHSGFLKTDILYGGTVLTTSSAHLPENICFAAWDSSSTSESGFHVDQFSRCTSPLSQRGWAYQEEILSSRYVKFTNTDVLWTCHSDAKCMCREDPASDYLNQWRRRNMESPLKPVFRWTRMLDNYSQRLLSKQFDKLVAISGLARMM
ncbi:heterokaryon incompatibility protein-domain-containing protein, partial [Podospora fimiseda]